MPKQAARVRADAPIPGFHVVRIPDAAEEEHRIELEISADKLYQLLVCGAVSVADFRCLDHASKARVRTLCLHACGQRLRQPTAARTARRHYPELPS
jgi:hypothetical protein